MKAQSLPFWDQLHSLYLAGEVGQLLELADAVEQTVWRDLISAHARLERALDHQQSTIRRAYVSDKVMPAPIDWHGLSVSVYAKKSLLRTRLLDAGIAGIYTEVAGQLLDLGHQRFVVSLSESAYLALIRTVDV